MNRREIEKTVAELRKMYTAEVSGRTGGHGATLTHWSGCAEAVKLDAAAIRELLFYYLELLDKCKGA